MKLKMMECYPLFLPWVITLNGLACSGKKYFFVTSARHCGGGIDIEKITDQIREPLEKQKPRRVKLSALPFPPIRQGLLSVWGCIYKSILSLGQEQKGSALRDGEHRRR